MEKMESAMGSRQIAVVVQQGATERLPDNGVSLIVDLRLGNNGNIRGSRISES